MKFELNQYVNQIFQKLPTEEQTEHIKNKITEHVAEIVIRTIGNTIDPIEQAEIMADGTNEENG